MEEMHRARAEERVRSGLVPVRAPASPKLPMVTRSEVLISTFEKTSYNFFSFFLVTELSERTQELRGLQRSPSQPLHYVKPETESKKPRVSSEATQVTAINRVSAT